MLILISSILYYEICILKQVHALNPSERWDDTTIQIPIFGASLSLRALMLNALFNFLIFIGKQLFLTVRHPNQAAIDMYPQIEWIDDE